VVNVGVWVEGLLGGWRRERRCRTSGDAWWSVGERGLGRNGHQL